MNTPTAAEAREMLDSPACADLPEDVRAATLANIEKMERDEAAAKADWEAKRGAGRPAPKGRITRGRIA